MSEVYLGNPNLKKANTAIEFTQEQIIEFLKCKEDPVYFANNYIKIVSLDEGLTQFHPYHFQEKLINNFHNKRFNICKMPRQTGKSTTVVSYLLHYAVFNDSVNIGILANKAATARELLGRLQTAYENLPKWMQQGIISWNKGSLELENGSKILAASTSASAVRGMSFNILFLDEFAFVPNHVADSFFASVYPTITSGKSTKVIIVSTPHGMNHFYRMWHDAEKGKNEYIPTDVHWSEVPGRDAKWKETTIANTSEAQFKVEFECEFLGSVNTLINPAKLRTLVYDDPVKRNAGLDIYENPIEEHNYMISVDVSRGLGNDYSAFIVFDITEFPYRVVAKYRNNEIKPMLFPNIIYDVAKAYNNSWMLIEINDIGDQVASILHFDLEYENILMCSMRGRNGQVVGSVGLYYTLWENRDLRVSQTDASGDRSYLSIQGQDQAHSGIEYSISYQPIPVLRFDLRGSENVWENTSDFTFQYISDLSDPTNLTTVNAYMDGTKIGGAPQSQQSFIVTTFMNRLKASMEVERFGNMYAQFKYGNDAAQRLYIFDDPDNLYKDIQQKSLDHTAVSYTHLTLPTKA